MTANKVSPGTFDMIIRNATVVTASDRFICDIGIEGGKVKTLSDCIEADATEIVDASGLLVLPGGVDVHCHLDEPDYGGARMSDDFASGSLSAACGGTTTMINFATQAPGESLLQAVTDYHEKARGNSLIDYSFHLIVSDPTDTVLRYELPALLKDGYSSIKVFMTYEGYKLQDEQIIAILETAKAHDTLVMVHAENDQCVCWMTNRLLRADKVGPRYFAQSRGPIAEREATHRAISLAELVGTPVYFVHVSSSQALEQIAWARAKRMPVFAETCPQYLTLSSEHLASNDWEAAKFICSPPPRDAANLDHFWDGLARGLLDVVASDHSAYSMEGLGGRKSGGELNFAKIAPGLPGVETRSAVMFSEGVSKGWISVNQFVALTASTPAKLFGLYPNKGTIAVGSDADIVLWDPNQEITLSNDILHGNTDYTPYEGMEIKGWPQTTIVGGDVVFRNGAVVDRGRRGRFLKRGVSSAFEKADRILR